jgi:PKD domain
LSRIDRGTDAKVDPEARTRASADDTRRTDIFRRLRAGGPRRKLVFLACAFALGLVGVAIAGPSGSLIPGSGGTEPGLTKAGPTNTDNGFPDWYRDSNKLDLEPCLDPGEICAAPPTPDPEKPASLADGNFPDEFFYMLADANLTANGGNDVLAEFALEGAFNAAVAPGEQIVFGRVRYRVRGGLQPDSDYKITHPYGTDTVHTDANSTELFVTQDVGVAPGDFNAPMTSRIGPFLTWDTFGQPEDAGGPPAGYVGDGATPHKVTGSALDQNYVRIEGPGIGGPQNPNPCPDIAETDPAWQDCIYTDLFTLVGKKSTRAGVEVARATYSRSADGATKQLDLFAGSKEGQSIAVQQSADVPETPRQFATTPLRPEGDSYFAHLDITGDIPAKVDVVNRGDTPQTVRHVTVTDHVTGAAVYHNTIGDAADPTAPGGTLHVEAVSSDKATTDGPVLTVLGHELTGGQVDIPLTSPPPTVEVTSSKGGSARIPVSVDGPGMAPLALLANAGPDQTVEQGATVQLNGNGSTGNITGYSWTGPDGITLDGADTATPTFTASQAGDYTFILTVTGVDGTPATDASSTDEVTVHVNEVNAPTARIQVAAADTDPATPVTVPQNLPVTLDASTSTGALRFAWTQLSGPNVTLSGADTAKATFTFPQTTGEVTLQLVVRNSADAGGPCDPAATPKTCNVTTVTLAGEPDTITPGKVRYVPDKSRWIVDGTASSTKQNTVTVYSGRTADTAMRIGSSAVDNLNAWSVDVRDSTVPLHSCGCVLMVSARGGEATATLEKVGDLPLPPAPAATTQAVTADAAPLALAAPRGVAAAPAAAAVPLVGSARLAVAGLAVTGAITATAVAVKGIPVTLTTPAGATVVRVRVLQGTKALLTTFRKVKAGKKARFRVRSQKLARKLRHGKRYRLEVRAGKNRRKLGKAAVRTFRVR